jgi:predicted peroxiredoxin
MHKRMIAGILGAAAAASSLGLTPAWAESWSNQVRAALTPRAQAGQSVVVSLKQDPASEAGFEAACVALQMATLLQMNGAEVTLFATLGGARIADQALLARDVRTCDTASGEVPLRNLVAGFINAGGGTDRILMCPLCWGSRYGFEPAAMENFVDGAYMGDAASMASVFLAADKILDF